MKQLLLLLLVTMLTAAQSQTTNYSKSGKVKIVSSSTVVSTNMKYIDSPSPSVATEMSVASFAPSFNDVPAGILNLISSGISNEMTEDTKRYESSFSGFYSGFTEAKVDTITLPIITIQRIVLEKKKSTLDTATNLILMPELSADKLSYRYRLDNASTYSYSAAKTRGRYMYIDCEILLKTSVITQSEDGRKVEDLRATKLMLTGIKIGDPHITGSYYSGWIPLPTLVKKQKQVNCKKGSPDCADGKKSIETYVMGLSGPFEIEATVKESNIYKAKAESRKSRYEAIAQPLIDLLSPLILLSPSK